MNPSEFPEWTRNAKALLDVSAQSLDAATLSRLNRARQSALAQRHRRAGWWLPAGLVSACMLLLAVGIWQKRAPEHPATSSSASSNAMANFQPDDLQMVSGEDSLDLYQNLDFYAWLDAQQSEGDG
ncbi:MAG TPA: hypothetical protein VFN13_06865 [Rudaea sp.]|nr:hypothetical protein [Rudaea sp.]